MIGSSGTEQRQLAIPLCLPNNWEFDPHSGKCHRVAPKRSTLTVNQEALKQLKRIKGTEATNWSSLFSARVVSPVANFGR